MPQYAILYDRGEDVEEKPGILLFDAANDAEACVRGPEVFIGDHYSNYMDETTERHLEGYRDVRVVRVARVMDIVASDERVRAAHARCVENTKRLWAENRVKREREEAERERELYQQLKKKYEGT